ncbi:MAG: tRNA pseudouridine(55) synthase TruB [Myxococcales bacterium]|nr:tRNA pseudouridine(55) synthase TruB [Myxococcales bacterium]
MARRRPAVVHGIIAIDKPLSMTSRDVVNRAMRLFGERRCGHAGTLDPDASGILVLAFGRATKVIRWLTDGEKTYATTVQFGAETLTDDAQGEVVRTAPVPSPWTEEVISAAASANAGGLIDQVPPAVSALKRDGIRDYERVRRGEIIEREARSVRLDAVRTIAIGDAQAQFEVDCGPGFYVRSWARDLGVRLDSAAHLCQLRRLRSSGFSKGVLLADLEQMSLEERRALLLPIESNLPMPTIAVDARTTVDLVDGKKPAAPSEAQVGATVLVLGPDQQAVCVAGVHEGTEGDEGAFLRVIRGLREDGAAALRAEITPPEMPSESELDGVDAQADAPTVQSKPSAETTVADSSLSSDG